MFESSEEELKKLFGKKFSFEKAVTQQLPPVSEIYTAPQWKIDTLQSLKNELNAVKSKLNDMKLEVWSEHTKFCNPAGDIVHKVRGNALRGEFVTQAWCKFYECLSNYEVVAVSPNESQSFKSLHLCEAPGGFIAALNHFLQLNHEAVDWQWTATTLNPYYEGNQLGSMIIDDRFIQHTLDHWHFGEDYSGDIMRQENVESLLEQVGKVNLVTADGSIDCLLEPERQEEIVAGLHLSEAVVALRALSEGGSFVLKMFTMFESSSICLMFLLNCLFDQLHVFKPAVSKEGNSEVYIICIGYSPPPDVDAYLKKIAVQPSTRDQTLFPITSIPDLFLAQMETCARYFTELQTNVIERNLSTFHQLTKKEQVQIQSLRSKVSNEYLRACRLRPITIEQRLLKVRSVENGVNLNPRRHMGSYSERKQAVSDEERLNNLQDRLRESLQTTGSWTAVQLPSSSMLREILSPKMGRPVKTLCSSKFVFAPELRLFHEIMTLAGKRLQESERQVIDRVENELGLILKMRIMSYFSHQNNYDEYERKAAVEILKALKELSPGKNLIIQQLPVLSHFLAGLVFYLSSFCFKKTFLYCESAIVFEGYMKENLRSLAAALEKKVQPSASTTVIGLVDVPLLYASEFHHSMLQYNMATVFLYSLEYLRLYELAAH